MIDLFVDCQKMNATCDKKYLYKYNTYKGTNEIHKNFNNDN
jgi:hypothetical protein